MSQEALLIYKSSAGSGKTFTLVKEYLKLVIANPFDYKSTLAMTFTNATMREMKEKVVNELLAIAAGKQTDTKSILEKEFDDDIDIQKNAARVLDLIIHNYSKFSIMTIDSFFSRVIRTFARELRLPLRYDIDLENDKALDASLEMLYEGLNKNSRTKKWLEQFALSRLDDNNGWNIDFNIKKLGNELFNDDFKRSFKKGLKLEELEQFIVKLKKEQSELNNRVKTFAHEALAIIEAHQLEINDFAHKKAGPIGGFLKAANGSILNEGLTKRFVSASENEKSWYTKGSIHEESILKAVHAGLQRLALAIIELVEGNRSQYISSNAVLKNIYSYGLLELLDKELINYRTHHNLMLLSDSGSLLKEIISDQDAPFIYEKFGSYFKHILIDEFQDTSNYQWNNLLPLIKNSLSDLNQILIVGDVKQSIYRWRGGDMQLLLKGIYEDLSMFDSLTSNRVLDTNWRSAKNIVEFNNSVFEIASSIISKSTGLPNEGKLILNAYEEIKQKAIHIDPMGFVELKFFDTEKIDDEESISWKDQAKKALIERIKTCEKDGFSLNDIMLLVEKNDEALELSEYLIAHRYKIVTETSMLVKNAVVVQLLINAMRWLSDPKDNIALAGLFWQHSQLNKKKARAEMFHRERIHEVLDGYFQDAESNVLRNLAKKPLYELVEELLRIFELNDNSDPYVMRFLELCLLQSQRGIVTCADFLQWWEEHKDKEAIVTPDNINAIRIMTVHKSKGLEAPVVMLPFAAFNFRSKGIFWTSELEEEFTNFGILPLDFNSKLVDSDFSKAYYKELMEGYLDNLNKAYVSFTRARKRLYVFSRKFKKDSKPPEALHKLLYAVVTDSRFQFKDHWDEELWELKIGKEELNLKTEEGDTEISNSFLIDTEGTYSDRILVRKNSQDLFKLGVGEAASKIRHGTILHKILEDTFSINDVDGIIEDLVAEGTIDRGESDFYLNPILELFKNHQFKSWYDEEWEIMAERSIYNEGRAYKPDRVLLKGDQAIIIDYKHEKESKTYEKQVTQYAQLLSKMGYKRIEKYLVFTESSEIIEVE